MDIECSTKNYSKRDGGKRKILLVCKDFFKNFVKQYDHIYETGLIKCRPTYLVNIVDNEVKAKN